MAMKRWSLHLISGVLAASLPVSVQANTAGVAGFEHLFPLRPACNQMVSTPSDQAGWRRWGYNHQGSFVQVYGMEEMTLENAFYWLDAAGICSWGGDAVDLETIPSAPIVEVNANPETPTLEGDESVGAEALADRVQSPEGGEGNPLPLIVIVIVVFWLSRGLNEDDNSLSLQPLEPSRLPPIIQNETMVSQGLETLPQPLSKPENMSTDRRAIATEVVPTTSFAQPWIETVESPGTAVDEVLKAPLYTRIIFGGQRSGKSYMASSLSRLLKDKNGTKIFAINLALVKNPEYWLHADRKAIADLTSHGVSAKTAIASIQEAMNVLNEFRRHENALLVIDEWTIIGATTFTLSDLLKPFIQEVCSTVTALASRGLQAGQAVWLIAPHCRLDFLEKEAKALKLCKLLLVAANPEQSFDVDGSTISFDSELFDQVKYNWRDITPPPKGLNALQGERIAYTNGEWMPLGSVKVTEPDPVNPVNPAEPESRNSVTPSLTRESEDMYQRISELCNLEFTEVIQAVEAISRGITKTDIIKTIWKKGGRYYDEYRLKYDHLREFI
ncbi:MAG: hypothetical protein AAFY26_08250 [Cyanobacteria bacterium J06638_22]